MTDRLSLRGPARLVGDDIDTDQIIPARFCLDHDPEILGPHCMSDMESPPQLKGAIVLAGWSFGCGSSREHAVYALIGAGVQAVVARSFSRIFYRNCINVGLLVLEAGSTDWDAFQDREVQLDLDTFCFSDAARSVQVQLEAPNPSLLGRMLKRHALSSPWHDER